MYSPDPVLKRVEFRSPDPSCNPYLAFAALLMAGIDGFIDRLYNVDPSLPVESLYDLPPWDLHDRADHAFLSRSDVFTPDVIDVFFGSRGSP